MKRIEFVDTNHERYLFDFWYFNGVPYLEVWKGHCNGGSSFFNCRIEGGHIVWDRYPVVSERARHFAEKLVKMKAFL